MIRYQYPSWYFSLIEWFQNFGVARLLVTLSFKSVNEILWCYRATQTSLPDVRAALFISKDFFSGGGVGEGEFISLVTISGERIN